MTGGKNGAEIRAEIARRDSSKDVALSTGVILAVVAGLTSLSGIFAVLCIGFLESFRKDVDAFWLSCVPFCFPFITGVAVAYRKEAANVGLHIALLLAILLCGGAGYGYSIEPVFLERDNCTSVSAMRGDCHKTTLVFLYVISGGVACGAGVLGLLLSFVACSKAMKRKAKREYERQLRELREHDKANKQIQRVPQHSTQNLKTSPHAQALVEKQPPAPEYKTPSVLSNGENLTSTPQQDATTHL